MPSRRRFLALSGAMLLAGCGEPPPAPLPGPDLRALTLATLDGRAEPLAALVGKVVLLNVWATWCAPCRQEMPALQRLADRLDAGRFRVLGLAADDNPVFVREYLREAGLSFARHIDRGRRLSREVLGAVTLPQTLVFAGDGRPWHRIEGIRDWDAAAEWLDRFAAAPAAAGRL